MTKVTVEIEIPDGHEVVDGPEMEWSHPVSGEVRSTGFRVVTRPAKPLIICGEPADWPEWLDCDWITRDEDGQIRGFRNIEPQHNGSFWFTRTPGAAYQICCVTVGIPGPWEESKRENPRRKK